MPDPTNDIDAATRVEMLFSTLNACRAPEHHRETLLALIEERDALRKRVEELEAKPPVDRDRELRERLVCALIVPAFELYSASPNIDPAEYAVALADAVLEEMRKGEA